MMARAAASLSVSIPLLAASGGLGLAVVADYRLALAGVLAVCVGTLALVRGSLLFWDMLTLALAGTLILGYGFANVGLASAVPVPLVDVLLGALLLGALILKPLPAPAWPPQLILGVLFFLVAAIRLTVDVPVWGKDAVRDFTLPLELGFVLVGFWAFRTFGIERWISALRWIFLLCLAYFVLYPAREQIAAASPLVGLQRETPLFGSYAGAGTAAASALFFCAFLRPFGRVSYLLAAGFLGLIVLFQSRGLYLAVPAASALTWIFARREGRIRSGLTVSVAAGAVVLTAIFLAAPAGRLGTVSPGFITAQLETLHGGEGPGAGSFEHRQEWFDLVVDRVESTPAGWAVGVGLGPDLAGGFRVGPDAAVRKPHNDFLEVFARFGLLGLLLFGGFLISILARIVLAARRAVGQEAAFLWWVFATALVYLFIAATQPLLAFPYGTVPLFTALGAGLALAMKSQEAKSSDLSWALAAGEHAGAAR